MKKKYNNVIVHCSTEQLILLQQLHINAKLSTYVQTRFKQF